ncbi:MAG: NADPH:quinone oxidoreductase family protein [Actinomycetota bacterium]|nr:NADPH:quinone oxidoreductase family protein [Actinomycetota bacterium]
MKAVLCKEYGPPESLVVEEVPDLEPTGDQVVVSVQAAGVNFPDALIIQGKYQFKPPMPFAPGGEVSGIVAKVGSSVVGVNEGDRVIALTGWGGFAEQVAIGADRIVPMPDSMDFPTAAALMFTYGTSHYALRDRARLKTGESLLVLGAAGGVGLAAVEIGKAIGARVIAAASSADKLQVCREHGADDLIDYKAEDLKERVKALTGGNGVDVIYDPVGGEYSEPALRTMAWDGRFLVIGFAAGDIPKIPLNLALLKSCSIVGVFWGAFTAREPKRNQELIQELLGWYAEGTIKPHIYKTYPLEKAADAINDITDRKVKGKVVLLPGS